MKVSRARSLKALYLLRLVIYNERRGMEKIHSKENGNVCEKAIPSGAPSPLLYGGQN